MGYMDCAQHTPLHRQILRSLKLKVTPARLAILEVFEHYQKPLSIQDIAKKVEGLELEIDTVTLYRNVESLKDLGLLVEVSLNERDAHYELVNKHHHHHLICEQCGKVADISLCHIPTLSKKTLESTSFGSIKRHSCQH